jgi:hypothetical protein
VFGVELWRSSADQCGIGLDLHALADHHVGGISKAHAADGQVRVIDVEQR